MPTTSHLGEWNGVRFVDIILWALNCYREGGGFNDDCTFEPFHSEWNITTDFFYFVDGSRVDYLRNSDRNKNKISK